LNFTQFGVLLAHNVYYAENHSTVKYFACSKHTALDRLRVRLNVTLFLKNLI